MCGHMHNYSFLRSCINLLWVCFKNVLAKVNNIMSKELNYVCTCGLDIELFMQMLN